MKVAKPKLLLAAGRGRRRRVGVRFMNGSFLLRRRPPARLAVWLLPPTARLVLSSAAPGSASYPEKGRARWAWSSGRVGEGKISLGREERVELKAPRGPLFLWNSRWLGTDKATCRFKKDVSASVVAGACHSSTWETEAEGLL